MIESLLKVNGGYERSKSDSRYDTYGPSYSMARPVRISIKGERERSSCASMMRYELSDDGLSRALTGYLMELLPSTS